MFLTYLLALSTFSKAIASSASLECLRLANALGSPFHGAFQESCQSLGQNISSVDRAQVACKIVEAVLEGSSLEAEDLPLFIGPQSPFYVNRTRSSWSDNCWQRAACVVAPQSPEDVARVMRIIVTTRASFAVRSGGHDFNVNHSSVNQAGIVLDMVNFNQTTLNRDNRSIEIGVGARWGDVYQYLNGTGVSVNGARSPNPGVGGQTLGGGIGWFTNLAGVSAASVVAAEVVLANSSIVRVDETTSADLLWALKGGGPNYGIVTSFTYNTLPIGDMWFESRLYTPDQNQRLLDALISYQSIAASDTKANIVYQLSENTTIPQSFVGFLYLDAVARPPVFAPFYDIPSVVSRINSTVGNLAQLAALYYDPVYPQTTPSRNFVVSVPHKIDRATYQESFAAFTAYAKEAATFGAVLNYGSQPISPDAVQASRNTPLNLTYVNQDWIHVTLEWQSPSNDAHAVDMMKKLGNSIRISSVKHGADLPYVFMNDAYDGQDVLSGYGAGSLQKLRQIANDYDPQGVFQRLQNGGWLLDSA